MHEVAQITLENELDLLIANRRTMKLGELASLSLSAQTTFATAVSEVSRMVIESEKRGTLTLGVENNRFEKYLVATLKNGDTFNKKMSGNLDYAKKLVSKMLVSRPGDEHSVELYYGISPTFPLDVFKIDEWRNYFRNEPSVSPYEELKRKNEQLQELSEKVQKSELLYKTLANSLPLMIFSLDGTGNITYVNERVKQYTGYNTNQLTENKWTKSVHPDDYNAFSMLLQENFATGSITVKTQARLKNTSGEYFWHQVALAPVKSDSEDPSQWIGYLVDIHAQKVVEETRRDNLELKQMQEELQKNQVMLERYIEELNRSNQELQQFAFIASHDLQEPVRKVLYYSDFLLARLEKTEDKKTLDVLQKMQAASLRMRNLIREILLFSQIKKEETQFFPVDLHELATEVLKDHEVVIQEKQAVIKTGLLPEITGDRGMISQVFSNIIGNALKYTRDGIQPQLDISAKITGNFTEIAFRDNGIGFDDAFLPKMFTLFQRLHSRERYEGTGLGLAICRKIMEFHQGEISAVGTEGSGATFFIRFALTDINVHDKEDNLIGG